MKNFKILDCTLRDGGYYNNWDFPNDLVNDYLKTMSLTEVKYIELGFRSFQKKDFKGPNWYTSESYINSLSIPKKLKMRAIGCVALTNYCSGADLFSTKSRLPIAQLSKVDVAKKKEPLPP